jgi:hypothetical protein
MTINAYSRNNRIRFRYAQQLSDDGWNGTSHCRQMLLTYDVLCCCWASLRGLSQFDDKILFLFCLLKRSCAAQ